MIWQWRRFVFTVYFIKTLIMDNPVDYWITMRLNVYMQASDDARLSYMYNYVSIFRFGDTTLFQCSDYTNIKTR